MSIAPQAGQRMGGFGSAVFGSRFIEVTCARCGERAKVKTPTKSERSGSETGTVWLPLDVYLVPARGADEHTEDHARGRGARHPRVPSATDPSPIPTPAEAARTRPRRRAPPRARPKSQADQKAAHRIAAVVGNDPNWLVVDHRLP